MSWASRRRFIYLTGTTLFFLIVLGGPLAWWYLTIPATCTDGITNHGETSIDKGGPCPILDERVLQPEAALWSRSFRVRDGTFTAIAYVQNPNDGAGVSTAHYRFGLYDDRNILVAEREGDTYIMPGAVTPVLESRIDTGNRIVARTYFEFTDPLIWRRFSNTAASIQINSKELSDTKSAPRLSATAQNTSVAEIFDIRFIASIFDPAGNAFAVSGTALPKLAPGETAQIIFTWPDAFSVQTGRVDIVPLASPTAVRFTP